MGECCCKARVENTTWKGEAAVRFCAGGYEALMIPGVGANVIELKDNKRGLDLLRSPENIDLDAFKVRPQVYGIPVLFPPNRIEDGTFTKAGRTYRFTINEVARNNHLHGFLHKRPWKITKMEVVENKAEVEATFINDSSSEFFSEFPHEFEFKLLYTLSCEGLVQKVTITNNSSSPMPMGLGFHTAFKIPFHPESKEQDYKMNVSIDRKWALNERVHPVGEPAVLNNEDEKFRGEGVTPVGHVIDMAHFTVKPLNIEGKEFHGAIIEDGSKGLKLVYEVGKDYKHWMLWNETGDKGFVCPEPQTWVVNAPNIKLPDEVTGFRLLEPGEVWIEFSKFYVVEG